MTSTRPAARSAPMLRLLVAMVTIGLGMAWTGSATASAPAKAGHRCACGTACKGSCCCTRDTAEPPPVERKISESPGTTPCLANHPCGGGDAPTISVGPSAPKAIVGRPLAANDLVPGTLLAIAPVASWATPPASRIDDPPDFPS